MNSDPVLGLDQYTSPGIQYYQMSKIKQYAWLANLLTWIINEFEIEKSSYLPNPTVGDYPLIPVLLQNKMKLKNGKHTQATREFS